MTMQPAEITSSNESEGIAPEGGVQGGGKNGATKESVPLAIPGISASSVLSTMNDDGSRRWLKPRVSLGRFLRSRRAVAYSLIAIFAGAPFVRIYGRPLLLIDIAAREFHILGSTFYPTDTLLMALLLVGAFLTIFWVTALLGRVWCGWACPQTVYMEFLFRPIERFFEGAPGRTKKGIAKSKMAKPLKWISYFAASAVIAHLFLAYFVPWETLRHWMFGSPGAHPAGFLVVLAVTLAMTFDFGYFREQVCLVACPYGRFQSVMLDRHSLIIRYDRKRGEPRGHKRAGKTATVSLPVLAASPATAPVTAAAAIGLPEVGDCVDCKACVTTCPTGIDIRNGLQMECIGCAQCIDACDAVMDKLQRPRGLIRYSSQAAMEGKKFKLIRPRVMLYPTVITVLAALFAFVLLNTGLADVTVMRGLGQPFTVLAEGNVRNTVRVKIANRLREPAKFTITAEGVEGAVLKSEYSTIVVPAGQMQTVPVEIDAPAASFRSGKANVMLVVSGPEKFVMRRPFTLLGPAGQPGSVK